jgi:trk system potassium uptake protein
MNTNDERFKIQERLFKKIFLTGDRLKVFIRLFIGFCSFCFKITLFLFLIVFIFYIGFTNTEESILKLRTAFRILFLILFFSKFLSEILHFRKKTTISFVFEIIVFLFSFGVLLSNFNIVTSNKTFWVFFFGNIPVVFASFLIAISEISVLARFISSINIPPALLFSTSFFIIILIGSGLLLLPKAHDLPLTFLDSFFTSVSAVCVTGLVVVDTAISFTPLGKIIILCLIQIGGLGIMTFTGFFSFIFASSSSFRDRLLLKEIFSSQSLDNLFKLLTKIILWTFLTEMAGALLIYGSLDPDTNNKVLFSIFHAVSAFCNAGFSTLSEGLFSQSLRHNYSIQITIALLVILGGIGFPVLLNVYSYLKQFFFVLIRMLQIKQVQVIHNQMNISGRIVVSITLLLLLAGTGLYYLFESENSLTGMDNLQKFMISFFGSISSRTAGFHITDITLWSYPTVFLIMLLMWIGASPGSTGGGIKTTTFAIALSSAYNSVKGRQHLVIGNREIGSGTIIRVLAIIFLSILIITLGFFCLLLSEPAKNPIHLLFECISAFSTVGFSLANTSSFSETGKIVVIFLMFIGRVGPLTLLTGLLLSYQKIYSRYPEIDIVIN